MKRHLNINDEHILHFAFRYALPRHTTAPHIVTEMLIAKWQRLRSWTQEGIKSEIKVAFERGEIIQEGDKQTWQQILDLPTNI